MSRIWDRVGLRADVKQRGEREQATQRRPDKAAQSFIERTERIKYQ